MQHCYCYSTEFFYTDINECLEAAANQGDICLGNTQCVNTPGSFECVCASGYMMMEGTCQRTSVLPSTLISVVSAVLIVAVRKLSMFVGGYQ